MISRRRGWLIWAAVALALTLPLAAAAQSPLLQWRSPVYVAAGFAGIVAMCLLLLQALLAAGALPGLGASRWRRLHRWVGASLVLCILFHVAGLWVTSPPDVVDALLFVSPTPFSDWGVVAMWAVLATAALAVLRYRLHPRRWRLLHVTLAMVIAPCSVVHALLVEGTMETFTKLALSLLVLAATARVAISARGTLLRRARG